jgi:hypothetical protein
MSSGPFFSAGFSAAALGAAGLAPPAGCDCAKTGDETSDSTKAADADQSKAREEKRERIKGYLLKT